MSYNVDFEYQGAAASLYVWDGGEVAALNTLSSTWRRHGNANRVMALVLAYADAFDIELLLQVVPFGDEPRMKDHELKAFYRTFGFLPTGGDTMRRLRMSEREADATPTHRSGETS